MGHPSLLAGVEERKRQRHTSAGKSGGGGDHKAEFVKKLLKSTPLRGRETRWTPDGGPARGEWGGFESWDEANTTRKCHLGTENTEDGQYVVEERTK